ncbi:hypothetical protein MGN70_007927 [Eutypa lata]|nr:hypothetical protein MGN70_007927 [Eutypa lata]
MEDQAREGPPTALNKEQTAVVAPSSPLGQKRPRDLGEELKGLTSDEEGEVSISPRLPKKKKTHHSNSDDSASESLDDGEIVEPSSSRPGSGHDAETLSRHSSPQIQSADSFPTKTDGPAGSAQQSVVGFNRGISLGMRTSFGKGAAAPFSTTRSTSISASSTREEETKQGQQTVDEASRPDVPAQAEAQQQEVTAEPDSSPLSFSCGKTTWQIPRLETLGIPETPEAQTEAFWRQRLFFFIVTLFQANEDPWERLEVKPLRTALDKYVSKDGGFLSGSNKHAKAVRKTLQQVTADKQALASMIQRAREMARAGRSQPVPQPVSQPVKPVEVAEGESEQGSVLTDEERQEQHKYFPNAVGSPQHCISCSGTGHKAGNCPKLACRFCESVNHHSLSCPTKQRCTKCHQVGHSIETCTEKLALTADEQDPCTLCGGDHLENDCSEVWRSYDPLGTTIKKVKAIPAFCYTCGNEGHYGPECALPGRRSEVAGRTSWSQVNRDLYVDPQSDLVAIAWVGIPTEVSNFQIRGRATRNTHTHFISDDDSDDDFIREPVRKPQPRGQMRIATNIANGPPNGTRPRRERNNQSRKRQQEPEFEPPPPPPQDALNAPRYNPRNSSWQPPLPPGPPPPSRTNGLPGSAVSLPPRPGTFTQGNGRGQGARPQNNRGGRGYRGSRGGRRGNGRGRGQ